MKLLKSLYEFIFSPLCILLAVLCGAVLLVASPLAWKTFYKAPEQLPTSAQYDGEIIAKNLWSNTSYADVSKQLKGGTLHLREIHHYEDLQKKIRRLTCFFVTLLIMLLIGLRHPRLKRILAVSLLWLLILSLIGTFWALHDWKHFFHTLHWWIFQNASWKLPKGCYSLQLYPYPIWKTSLVITFIFCITSYLLLFCFAYKNKLKR